MIYGALPTPRVLNKWYSTSAAVTPPFKYIPLFFILRYQLRWLCVLKIYEFMKNRALELLHTAGICSLRATMRIERSFLNDAHM